MTRLIDAKELKSGLKQYFSDGTLDSVSAKLAFNMILRKIDEAPTVSGITKEKLAIAYEQGYEDGKNNWLQEERPHGEWNYIQAGMCVCPFCGAMPHKLYKNFCTKCGADMRPKKKIQTPSCLTNPERQAELLERYKEE